MSNDQNSSNAKTENIQNRQSMVDTAVNFLLNPAVIDKPSTHKTAFLKKKGLTDTEISVAYERAEKDPKYQEFQRSSAKNVSLLPPPVPMYNRSVSFWSRLSRVSSSVIVLGVALFGAHYIYKNYIEPIIFGNDSKEDRTEKIEKHLQETTKLLAQLENKLSTLEGHVECRNAQMDKFFQTEVNAYSPTPLVLRDIKVELGSVKSILLNRHQFPALPKVTSASIPDWQLPKEDSNTIKQNGDTIQQNGEVDEHQEPPSPETQTPTDESFVNVENDKTDEAAQGTDTDSAQSDLLAT